MCEWAAEWARKLGGSVEMRDIGTQVLGGATIPLPPIVLAAIPPVPDPTKKTVCVYGEYVLGTLVYRVVPSYVPSHSARVAFRVVLP